MQQGVMGVEFEYTQEECGHCIRMLDFGIK